MRHVLFVLTLLASFVSASSAQDNQEKAVATAAERIVVPIEGATKFTVSGKSTLFRISASTIAGGTIDAPRIKGSAKLVRSAEIVHVDEDGQPMIGALEKEFVFRGTAAGTVTIEIRMTLPTEPMPVLEVYTVTVK